MTAHKLHPVLRLRVAPGTKLVWLYLKLYAGRRSEFRFNIREAAADLGTSTATVYRALTRLQAAGFVTWQRSRGGNTDDRCGLVTLHERRRPASAPAAPAASAAVRERRGLRQDTRPGMCRHEFRAARKRLGLTQAELAAALGATQQAVSKWERGDTRIPQPGAVRLALAALERDEAPRRSIDSIRSNRS